MTKRPPLRLCVAGGTGFVGAHVVRAALARGDEVAATWHAAEEPSRLYALPGAAQRLRLHPADTADPASFDPALRGADALCIACFPTRRQAADGTPEAELDPRRGAAELVQPLEQACLGLMAAAHRHGIRRVVLCSSTASADPQDPAVVRNEVDHVSDLAAQLAARRFGAAQKTAMEQAAQRFAQAAGIRLSILLASMVVGPPLLPGHVEGHVLAMLRDLAAGRPGWHRQVPAGSMSLTDPDALARMVLAALDQPQASGRYFAITESRTWQDLYGLIARHVPASALPAPAAGPPEPPTRFDFTRRESLGVAMPPVEEMVARTFAALAPGRSAEALPSSLSTDRGDRHAPDSTA